MQKKPDDGEDLKQESHVTSKEESSPVALRGACGTSRIVQDIFSAASDDMVDLACMMLKMILLMNKISDLLGRRIG